MKLFGTGSKSLRNPASTCVALALLVLGVVPGALAAAPQARLDNELAFQAARNRSSSSNTHAIVMLQPGAVLPAEFEPYAIRSLDIIHGYVLSVPTAVLERLAGHSSVLSIHFDRPAAKLDYRTSLTVGSLAVTQSTGMTGTGVGVAVIDSGITWWHDDLTPHTLSDNPWANQRVSAFVDFVGGDRFPYDDNGHGTHVAGIIAGNGYNSYGQKAGIAPDANIVSLKVLDANGRGNISDVIAALDWVLAHHAAYNIRVVNLSVGAAVRESYRTDPLTLAAKRVVDAGVVVVSAAGNFGKNADGLPQYGGINAPGNAPWVLTVGASTTNGSVGRADDTLASFSSRGPTYLDWSAKPDLVAPGVGTVSLSNPYSTMYWTKEPYLVAGTMPTGYQPYLSLSGTSMAAPVVSGTVALMLQANPSLTPNAVKAILQYTAQAHDGLNPLTQGAGFLNSLGAVRLARFYATARPGDPYPGQTMWSKHVVWGNHMLTGGVLLPTANAWSLGTTWGVAKTDNGDNIVWGTVSDGDNIVWGTSTDGDNIVWGTSTDGDNIVWGTDCGGADCGDNIVWGTARGDGDNIVWGTADVGDNIVWGTQAGDNIVWGTGDVGDNIVWGTVSDGDNIVWGTATDGDNIVWGTATDGDNIVWGTVDSTVFSWITSAEGTPVLVGNVDALTDEQVFAVLSHGPAAVSLPPIVEPPPATLPPSAPPDPIEAPDSALAPTPDPTAAPAADPAVAPTPDSTETSDAALAGTPDSTSATTPDSAATETPDPPPPDPAADPLVDNAAGGGL
jgi:serine protease AprX